MAIQASLVPVAYNNYRKHLKTHLDSNELKDICVSSQDYSSESFRLGGLSVMGADKIITPVFPLVTQNVFVSSDV